MKSVNLILVVSFFFSFWLLPNKAISQNELQFSQVLTHTGTDMTDTPTYTVPSNKVWKVVNIQTWPTTAKVVVNDVALYPAWNANYAFPGPYWLKAGDTIKCMCSNPEEIEYYFSIIEYSVIPIE